jgi:hypothetical protein
MTRVTVEALRRMQEAFFDDPHFRRMLGCWDSRYFDVDMAEDGNVTKAEESDEEWRKRIAERLFGRDYGRSKSMDVQAEIRRIAPLQEALARTAASAAQLDPREDPGFDFRDGNGATHHYSADEVAAWPETLRGLRERLTAALSGDVLVVTARGFSLHWRDMIDGWQDEVLKNMSRGLCVYLEQVQLTCTSFTVREAPIPRPSDKHMASFDGGRTFEQVPVTLADPAIAQVAALADKSAYLKLRADEQAFMAKHVREDHREFRRELKGEWVSDHAREAERVRANKVKLLGELLANPAVSFGVQNGREWNGRRW